MRILITGSRDWTDAATIEAALLEFDKSWDVTLMSGACPTGADALCEEFAHHAGWKVEVYPADWDAYGKKAGFIRNAEMVNMGADVCIAFIKNGSKGATMTRDLAQKAGIRTITYVMQEEPVHEKYVVGFAFDKDGRIALILKERPGWQQGLFNGIGGKVEEGETPLDAMIREFDEETGVLVDNWQLYVTLQYPKTEIFFFKALVEPEYLDNLKMGEESRTDEFVFVFTLEEFNKKRPADYVRNLEWLIPMAMYDRAIYLPVNVVVTDFRSEGNDEVD